MTLMEKLKGMFGSRLDEEFEDTKENEVKPTDEHKDDIKYDIKDDENGGEQVVEQETMFLDGWFNKDKLTIDKSKIKSTEALEALNQVLEVVTSNSNKTVIDKAVTEAIIGCNSVISNETLINMLDLSNITVKEGKAIGVKEAFDSLKSKEPKLFTEAKEESNPIKEGFNPVQTAKGNDNRPFYELAKSEE